MKVFQALEILKDDVAKTAEFRSSICVEMYIRKFWYEDLKFDDWESNKRACFKDWPHHSEHPNFPVPLRDKDGTLIKTKKKVEMGFRISACKYRLWAGPYGDLRRELLDHCIEWFKEKDL